jgi:hypothetical protein
MLGSLLLTLRSAFRRRTDLALENLALENLALRPLAALRQRVKRPRVRLAWGKTGFLAGATGGPLRNLSAVPQSNQIGLPFFVGGGRWR